MIPLIAACLLATPLANPPLEDDNARAGYPQEISRFARPIDLRAMIGYAVGGGAANFHKAEPPLPDEGTWGWDYSGCWFHRRVANGWWHGRRYQGGSGAYKTDGPRVLPE